MNNTNFMMNKKVSVIIPAYNVEDYIEECINSVLEQTYNNYEIIIVNDGSTDNTLNIVREYEKKYSCIKVINISNHGQGYARNVALSKASGEYILFLDSDDFLEKVTLQVAVDRIEQDKTDLVLFDWKYYYENTGKYRYVNMDVFFGKKMLIGEEVLELFRIKHYFTVNKLYSKKFLTDNNIRYGEGYIYEDNPFWVEVVLKAQKVSLIQSPLYNIRINESSTTKTNKDTDKHYKGFIQAIEQIIKLIKTKPENDYYYLYNYLMKKFNLYYKKRVPRQYKKKFVYDFVDVMHEAIELKDINVKNTLIKIGFKYHIFSNRRKRLFYFIYQMFQIKKCIKYRVKRLFNKSKRILKKIGFKKDNSDNSLEYRKAMNCPKENSILFMGFDYRYTGNSRYLFEKMLKKNINNIFFVTEDKLVEDKYRIEPNSREMYYRLYNSKIIIFESWTPKRIRKMNDSVWIQLWHGTPLKRMLFDSEESEIIKNNKKHKINKYNDINKWDYLILDNENVYQYFQTSFLIPKEKTVSTGYPRVNYLIENKNNTELKNKIRKNAKISDNKKVILYLPTWRDYNYGLEQSEMNFDYFMDVKKLQKILGDDYIVVSKNHTFMNNEKANEITNIDIETQELLLIADYLITDYSSVMFDAFAIDIPVIILANDYSEYQKSRGVYQSIWKDLISLVTYNEEEIADKITKYETNKKDYLNIKEKYGYRSNLDLVDFVLNIKEGK